MVFVLCGWREILWVGWYGIGEGFMEEMVVEGLVYLDKWKWGIFLLLVKGVVTVSVWR